MDYPKRGDIYLVNFDPTVGHEIKKARPAVVISNDINNEHSHVLTVVPLSSKVSRIFPFEVPVSAGGGLDKDSKILVNQIRSVDKKRFLKKISGVTRDTIFKIEAAIKSHFDME